MKFTKTNLYGSGPDDVYTIEEFKARVKSRQFIDYDGDGSPVKDNLADKGIWIHPSRLDLIPDDATHIVWYNR